MKNTYLIGIVVIVAIIIGSFALSWGDSNVNIPNNSSCDYGQLNYYFRSDCSHCIRVSKDGSLEKLIELGVEVNKFEVVEWGMYGIQATPTFEIGNQRISGYRTFDQLKGLLGCE
ncbi:MAG: hypothetical protein V3U72_03505 [Candidatus Aenigmarchaeota archaeon]